MRRLPASPHNRCGADLEILHPGDLLERSDYLTRSSGGVTRKIKLRTLRKAAPRRLFRSEPSVGLVITTFGSLPYVRLHLEARRRFYPQLPLLVHDDCSSQCSELYGLCEEYGADFETSPKRALHQHGDLLGLAGGMAWARERNFDLLVKLSRRFIPLTDWRPSLLQLAMESQYATYSSWTTSWNFGFRTECLAVAVKRWFDLGLFDEVVERALGHNEVLVEQFVHDLARRAARYNCEAACDYDLVVGSRPLDRDGYAVWPFMGYDRNEPSESFLWHNSSPPERYLELAQQWQIAFELNDFVITNMEAKWATHAMIGNEKA